MRTRIAARLTSAVVMATSIAVLPTLPARALDAVHLTGTGSISPGIRTNGCDDQNVSFFSTSTVVAGEHTGTYDFTYSGISHACRDTEHGVGTVSGHLTGSLEFHRLGTDVNLAGNVTLNGGDTINVSLRCAWLPTSVNPISTYAMSCAGGDDSAPVSPALGMVAQGSCVGSSMTFSGTATLISNAGQVRFDGFTTGCAPLQPASGSGRFSGALNEFASFNISQNTIWIHGNTFAMRCAFAPTTPADGAVLFALACPLPLA